MYRLHWTLVIIRADPYNITYHIGSMIILVPLQYNLGYADEVLKVVCLFNQPIIEPQLGPTAPQITTLHGTGVSDYRSIFWQLKSFYTTYFMPKNDCIRCPVIKVWLPITALRTHSRQILISESLFMKLLDKVFAYFHYNHLKNFQVFSLFAI